MRYDLAATLIVGGLAAADLNLRIRVNDGDAMALHMATIWLSLSALPWTILKIPVLGDLIHQMRPTAFDQRAGVRLLMNVPQMKRKQARMPHPHRTEAVPPRARS